MRLERIEVGRLRGAGAGFTLGPLAPGLNLIVGPNGCGKSSLCAALQSMLWPDADIEGAAGTELVAWWVADLAGGEAPGVLRGELHAGGRSPIARVDWQREGTPVDRPGVPPPHLAPVYTLGLRDLLADEHPTDLELALQIRVEISGGFDVAVLRGTPSSRFGQALESDWREAVALRARLEGDRRRLAEEDDRLEALRAARAEAESAQLALEALGAAAEIARLRDELALADRSVADLAVSTQVLEALRGDEREVLATLLGDDSVAREECEEAARSVAELETERASLRLPDPRPDSAVLVSAREIALELREADALRRARADQLAGALHTVDAAARSLAGEVARDTLPRLDVAAVDVAAGWVARAIRLASHRAELEGAIEAAGSDHFDARELAAEADALRRRADVLRDWLSSPLAVAASTRTTDGIVLIFGAAIAGLALYWPMLWLLGLAGLAVGVAVARLLAPVAEGAGVRAELERRFRDLPTSVDTDADRALGKLRFEAPRVREAVAEIDTRLADLARRHAEAITREERRRSLVRLDEEAAGLAADGAALAKRIGIDPGLGEVAFADLLDRLRRFRDAETTRARIAGECAEAESMVTEMRERLAAVLPERWRPADAEVASWLAAADDLATRCDRDEALASQLERARAQQASAESRARRIQDRRTALLTRAGLASDESDEALESQLVARLVAREAYQEIRQARRAGEGRIRELELVLEGHPELCGLESDDANARLLAARERAGEVGDVADEIARIEERVQAAASSGALEDCNARITRTLGALASARDELSCELAADFLLEEVEAEYERHTRPELLEAASELFARFTQHRYRLEVARHGTKGIFRALDTGSGRGLGLGELSDGTRMQLLLAARLAFSIHAEASNRPPIFLDEALTASDPERFRAVVEGLIELAADGRQIFYLTCNPSDVALFEKICAAAAAPAPFVFDLGERREQAAGFALVSELALAPVRTVPEPGDDSPERYALRIGVSRPIPGESAAQLHLFHVLRDDLALLHRLISEARVERIGHWHSLRTSAALSSVLAEDECARVDEAVDVAERYLDAFAVGRGRRVDRAVLEETGAVSEHFIDKLTALAQELGGDARTLVEAVEAKRVGGFRTSQLDKLRDALEASGHLDWATPLDAEALRVRALAGVSAVAGGRARAPDLEAAQREIDWLQTLFGPDA